MTLSGITSPAPRLDYVMCASSSGTHRMAYWEWGDPENPKVLLCVHGLTRNGRDFDPVARALATEYRVVCPDVVGRGRSDWLLDPTNYVIPQYAADMLMLIARLRPARLDWLGTSMGGLIGLALSGSLSMSASLRPPHLNGLEPGLGIPLGKMVLNDIGPAISTKGLTRIGAYVALPLSFERFTDAENHVRQTCADFGPQSDSDWQELTHNVFVCDTQGRWVKHYDIGIAVPFKEQSFAAMEAAEALLWQAYQSLTEPVLIIRGKHSDLLTAQTADDMLQANPRARLYEVAGVGHAPSLRSEEQIQVLREFLFESKEAI